MLKERVWLGMFGVCVTTNRNLPILADFDEGVSAWTVGQVTNMHGMFRHQFPFNQTLYEWDVSQVTDTRFMFVCASTSFDRGLSSWDVSRGVKEVWPCSTVQTAVDFC